MDLYIRNKVYVNVTFGTTRLNMSWIVGIWYTVSCQFPATPQMATCGMLKKWTGCSSQKRKGLVNIITSPVAMFIERGLRRSFKNWLDIKPPVRPNTKPNGR